MSAADLPNWAKADPLLMLLIGAGLTLDQAFDRIERAAIIADQWDVPQGRVRVIYDPHDYRQALAAWDPEREPTMPIRGHSA